MIITRCGNRRKLEILNLFNYRVIPGLKRPSLLVVSLSMSPHYLLWSLGPLSPRACILYKMILFTHKPMLTHKQQRKSFSYSHILPAVPWHRLKIFVTAWKSDLTCSKYECNSDFTMSAAILAASELNNSASIHLNSVSSCLNLKSVLEWDNITRLSTTLQYCCSFCNKSWQA